MTVTVTRSDSSSIPYFMTYYSSGRYIKTYSTTASNANTYYILYSASLYGVTKTYT